MFDWFAGLQWFKKPLQSTIRHLWYPCGDGLKPLALAIDLGHLLKVRVNQAL